MGAPAAGFHRELGLIDAVVVVAGAIIGVGIFVNPGNVARTLGDPASILQAWMLGGALALLGGFAYAELGSRMPEVGGQYVYLVRVYPPVVGFLYGVALLFIINTGGLAAVAIIFASYLDRTLLPVGPRGVPWLAACTLVALTAVNVMGVRAGKWTNNLLMTAKLGGMLGLMAMVLFSAAPAVNRYEARQLLALPASGLAPLLTALVPILFAYGGWQNCGAVAAEIREPGRTLAWANVIGVSLVVLLYVGLNVTYLRVLTPSQMAASSVLAADVAHAAAGDLGARLVSALILVSSLGFLSVITLTGPRLYYAMARDGRFFPRAGRLHARYGTPSFSLWFQCGVCLVLLASNSYDQLLSYVVFADWLFFALTVGGLFLLRRRAPAPPGVFLAPGHPFSTLAFVLVAFGIVANSFVAFPVQSLTGSAILLLSALIYLAVVRPAAAPAPR